MAVKRPPHQGAFNCCILKISTEGVLAFKNSNSVWAAFPPLQSGYTNIKGFSRSVESAISSLEKQIHSRIEYVNIIIDFGALKQTRVKVCGLNFEVLREKVEMQMGHQIINVSFVEKEDEYNILQILSMPKGDIQTVINVISSLGIQVIEINPDFKAAANCVFIEKERSDFALLKVSRETAEIAKILDGKIMNYISLPDFSLNSVLERVSLESNIPIPICEKLITFYNTTSKTARLKTYYERETEDYTIREIVLDQTHITSVLSKTRKILEELYSYASHNLNTSAICFYYASENPTKFHLIKECDLPFDIFEFQVEDI